MSKVLVVGDIHAPVTHPAYLRFCRDIADQWGCNRVHLIGDVVDWHAISFHPKHPDAPGASEEYERALACVQEWYAAFPKATVSIGNHDARVLRLAESVNIPSFLVKDYAEAWQTPAWKWEYDTVIDDVYYFHGTDRRGAHPAFNAVRDMGMSVVMGHVHTAGGVKWMCNPHRRLFGMDTGCGIDDRTAAMAYGKHFRQKSIIGCGVVIDGHPYYEAMPMCRGEKYHRSRFK